MAARIGFDVDNSEKLYVEEKELKERTNYNFSVARDILIFIGLCGGWATEEEIYEEFKGMEKDEVGKYLWSTSKSALSPEGLIEPEGRDGSRVYRMSANGRERWKTFMLNKHRRIDK